ncbi:hypothetical protein G114_04133 [Aeromonas diversa CDC 2478-85]|uniref:DUF1842 domain-containing protein n=1 Tax=Aeromonas diversa CDC 2478-85 TaxID=1268237 RepID=N9VD13_9GAMM|nr:DUF1842 domain-containing protein [Aeromonas diversa]ENY73122.1 hypothetical protein G114_04133 [Aeromonas diversa CDC 2478-85]
MNAPIDTQINTKTGLFLASFQIGKAMPGAPLLHLNLAVYTPGETVTGVSHVTQATNPPLDVASELKGQYTYMTVMPNKSHILVTAQGYPIVKWPQHGGLGPVIQPNLELRMVLSDDWKSGTANYKYQDGNQVWHEVKDVPVTLVPAAVLA